VPAGCRPHAEPNGYGGVGSIPEGRARRVPGADHHEGQGGSQRRGTRWMMSCDPLYVLRNFDLGDPPGPEEMVKSVVNRLTATNGTRTGGSRREPSHSGKEGSRWVTAVRLCRPDPSGQSTCCSPRVSRPLRHHTTQQPSGLLPCTAHGMPEPTTGQWSTRGWHGPVPASGGEATEGDRRRSRHPSVSLAGQGEGAMETGVGRSGLHAGEGPG